MKPVKLLLSGLEASGKSTLAASLSEVLVLNFDRKEYGFSVPHANFEDYEGLESLLNFIGAKIVAYKEKMGKLPKYVVLDTVTQLYSLMQDYNSKIYKGFDEHKAITRDALMFNEFLENSILPKMSVVIVAHAVWDKDVGAFRIPAAGSFARAGGWLSLVNDAVFVEKGMNGLTIHTQHFVFPARTTLKDLEESYDVEDYSLEKHLSQLSASNHAADDFKL